ncbi:TOPRIM nucleotidyl transferase/hydrolase domain-containing protein [Streptomyces sp. NPDC050560]|uniref:TOPRIM nucleotidyl transferase/hydrolase domain-containing protein n=1 Tax=Streptomyces sp. NPDC050560 TaxID=3365630 RepID=UPI0037B4043A
MERFRRAAVAYVTGRGHPGAREAAVELAGHGGLRSVVLVEGASDRTALEVVAELRGRTLAAEGVCVVPLGGVTNIAYGLGLFGPGGLDVPVAGLCDAGEEHFYLRGLERAGLGSALTRADMEALGFYVCVADLEDELIRGLGAARVEGVIDDQGDLRSFRIFQRQPAQRERAVEAQLRRFMGTRGGRKVHYARSLVEGLDPDRVPRPLDRLVARL